MTPSEDVITGEAGERYAKALFELADEAKALDTVEGDVETLLTAFGESADLAHALKSPVFKGAEKAAVLTELSAKLKLHKLTTDFMVVTARNGRAEDLKNILRAFKVLAAKRRGTSSADVISADPLTATQIKELKTALKTALGRDVEIRTEVREDIIGGLIVKVGSRMFDSSLKSKLEGLRKTMKEA